jgi:hypothetical protein
MLKKTMTIISLAMTLIFGQTVLDRDDGSRLAPRLLNYQGFLTDTMGNQVNARHYVHLMDCFHQRQPVMDRNPGQRHGQPRHLQRSFGQRDPGSGFHLPQ